MQTIKIGNKQPVDCQNCKGKYGYQQKDLVRTHYMSFYDVEGKSIGGQWSDSETILNAGKTAYCGNCGEKLLFKFA